MNRPTCPPPLDLARANVRDMLQGSAAFRALPPERQREIARHTVEVANYLIAPEGIPANKLPTAQAAAATSDPFAFAQPGLVGGGGRKEPEQFKAQAAREGAAVAGALLREVNFPQFVGGLITNVFQAIVTSSIQQMEAYGRLVADVAKTLNQFRDENVTANQGRDHLVEQFPDTFMIDVDTGENGAQPRVRLRDGVEESAALSRVNALPVEGGPLKSLDLEDEETEQKLVQAARTQLATSRQQLLATMVLMGINRIVVTDGKISAKVMYDFRAQDKWKRSAQNFDYVNMGTRTVSVDEEERQSQGPSSYQTPGAAAAPGGAPGAPTLNQIGGSYYSKGVYKTTEEPVVKISSVEATTSDAALSTKAQLAGSVEVNFKSDYFPLEKMADSFQIGMIQNASKPASHAPAGAPAPAPATPAPAPAEPAKV